MPGYIDLRKFRKVIKEEYVPTYSTPAYVNMEQIKYNAVQYRDRESIESYINNWKYVSNDAGVALDAILKLIGEVSNLSSNLSQSDYIYFCDLIKSKLIPSMDARSLLMYCESALSNDGLSSLPMLCSIINELKIVAEERMKINTVQENHVKLNKKIGIDNLINEINMNNAPEVIDSIYEICEKIDTAYPNLSTVKKFGVCIESILYASLANYQLIAENTILNTVTTYFITKVAKEDDFKFIKKAVNESQFYQAARKVETKMMLDMFLFNDETTEDIYPPCNYTLENMLAINEKKLTKAERDEIPDHMFGLPNRSFPLKDVSHVHSAMRYFKTADEKDRKLLARNILKRSKELKMTVSKDSDWYQYIKENNIYIGDVIFEAGSDNDIKKILLTLRQGSGNAAEQVKKITYKICAKPVENVVDETPDVLGFIRRFLIIGGVFAYNPYIGVVVALADFLISHEANRAQTSKAIVAFEREKRTLEKKLKKSDDAEKSKGYKDAIEALDKKINRLIEYKESLMTEKERDKVYGYSELAYAENIAANIQLLREMTEEYLSEGTIKDLVTITKENIRKGMSKMSSADRSVSNTLDSSVSGLTRSVERAVTSDKREAIVKGEVVPSFSKIVKLAIATGAAWAVNPAIAVIGVVGGLVISKGATEKERHYLLDEIDIELKIVDAKIDRAKSANDDEAYSQLLKIQKKLLAEQYRIKYNARVHVDDRDHGSAQNVKIKGGER